jgi:phenylalanyl-tRNA synthetase beta chain
MNIKIVDSWLREHLKTKVPAEKIAERLSVSSVSVERIEKYNKDLTYDIEVTSNRPDLMSVIGIAKEAAASLKQAKIEADFVPLKLKKIIDKGTLFPIKITNDPKLVNRICAVVLEVSQKKSPDYITQRLEASGIRSLNNLIDVTNYVMRETGQPAHVFDLDRLNTNTLIIRESKKGEKIITLDDKTYVLEGGDIVADNGKGEIVDLLGVMGTKNSVVTENTKRILFFVDNTEPYHIRKTSMRLGIRTEAAIINEKGVDPELSMNALLRGIELYKEIANANVVSEIFDNYPNRPKAKEVSVTLEKLNSVIGVEVPVSKAEEILRNLGFAVEIKKNILEVSIPSNRLQDISLEEDIIEEVARVFGYEKIPSLLPPLNNVQPVNFETNQFFWEDRVKNTLKYWGFNEVYTYSFVSADLFEGPISEAVELANPLSEEMSYLRKTLTPSLLSIIKENKAKEEIKIFEIANVYEKREKDLPKETISLAGLIKKQKVNFFEVKGIVDQLLNDLGIKNANFKQSEKGGLGAAVFIGKEYLGEIEVLENNLVDFELNFQTILKHVSLKKKFKTFSKYPPILEDLAIIVDLDVPTSDILESIKNQSLLISDVYLLDQYDESRTFHITYLSEEKNLTASEVKEVREQIITNLQKTFNAKVKS